jgi:glycerol-3-phosphate dehydrogenase
VFAGLRPLAASEGKKESTKEVSRHHKITVSTSGLVSVLGGKWTTYRKIAEDAINTVQVVGGFSERKCNTETLPVFGFDANSDWSDPLHCYGKEASKIKALDPDGNQSLSKKLFITKNQIHWAVQEEMASCLEDVLARRTRCLFLDAYETEKIAPEVARIMAGILNQDQTWIDSELKSLNYTIKNYQL